MKISFYVSMNSSVNPPKLSLVKNIQSDGEAVTSPSINIDDRPIWKLLLGDGIPLALGIGSYGLTFGLVGNEIGMSLWQVLIMSVFVYAGSAQLMALSLLAAQESVWILGINTFIINLRYFLLSTSILPQIKSLKGLRKLPVLYYLSDESFANLSLRLKAIPLPRHKNLYAIGLTLMTVIGWVSSSVLGHIGHSYLPDPKALGFDFAITAVYATLLALMITDKSLILITLIAGGLSVVFVSLGLSSLSCVVATLVATGIGVYLYES